VIRPAHGTQWMCSAETAGAEFPGGLKALRAAYASAARYGLTARKDVLLGIFTASREVPTLTSSK
jgi:hypothetical protein